jgi:hypothetical protein
MARPKTRIPGVPRFQEGERVVWKSGNNWKMGTVICHGKSRAEAERNLPEGYKIQYNPKNIDEKIKKNSNVDPPLEVEANPKQIIYLVAADTPLFKPGFTAHSVPERHLQKYKDSWFSKEEIMWENYKDSSFFGLALLIAKEIHENPKNLSQEILNEFEKICPLVANLNTNQKS